MLSAFTARPIVELKQRDKSKIESILAHGDRLFVGLNSGNLRIYRVNELQDDVNKENGANNSDDNTGSRPSTAKATKPADLLRELEKFSAKAIEQMAIIKEANILVSLSNSLISFHDLGSYQLQEQLARSKGAITFATTSNVIKDPATGIPEIVSRLAVSVKRKVLIWSWHESELSEDVVEITLQTAPIRSLTWASATKVICGMNSGYVIVDVITKEVEDIIGPGAIGGASAAEGSRFGGMGSASMGYMGLGGYIPKPLCTRLGEGEMLLAKDINSLFIDIDGKSLDRRQIPWSQSPDSVGYSYPYLVALQSGSKGVVEVRNPDTQSLLQAITLSGASQLHFSPPTYSLSHAGKGFHVVSDRSIWRMVATDYDSQVNELVENEKYDEAISVLDMLEDALLKDKEGRLREIKMLKAQMLFDQRKYRAALDLFIAVEAPPERVIRLYPHEVAGALVESEEDNSNHDEVANDAVKDSSNGDTISSENGDSKTAQLSVNKIAKGHKKTASVDTLSIRSSRKADDSASIKGSIRATKGAGKALEGKDLNEAIRELNSFLVGTRTRLQRFLDPVTGKLRSGDGNGQNTTSKQAFDALLLDPSSKEDAVREQQLVDTAKLVDTTLFRAYMISAPSLAASLFRLPNFCDPDVVGEKLVENGRYTDLIDFYHGKKLHRPALELLQRFGQAKDDDDAAPGLSGPERTIGYLQALPPEMIDLILEFAAWPLKANPDLGMEIFLADSENAETLPRDKVLRFLKGVDVDLAERYLEHIITELKDSTPDFHNKLVSMYIDELKERQDRESVSWMSKMEKLIEVLRTSKQYSLGTAFRSIPRDDAGFYGAQAIVLSNMGSHKQALEVYVFKLMDFDKAEEYCNQIHLQEASTVTPSQSRRASTSEPADDLPSIYHTLLSLYLTPPPPHKPALEPALSLLSRHGSRLPASSTLSLVPTDLPVSELQSYFQGRIRAANSIVNESRIVAGIRRSEVVREQALLLLGEDNKGGTMKEGGLGRNRRVIIGEDRVCGVCHKRLMRSVVAVLPDNGVVHYGCLNRAQGGNASEVRGLSGMRQSSAWGS